MQHYRVAGAMSKAEIIGKLLDTLNSLRDYKSLR